MGFNSGFKGLMALLSLYLLGKLHLSQNVGGIRLSQEKEFYPVS